MFDPIDFDPALLGHWPSARSRAAPYGEGAESALDAAVRTVWLETKAAAEPSPAETLSTLLADMSAEMRLQFETFRKIRVDADAKLAAGDEAEQKLAKADVKSATDALSLIVRTIEKIDSLQRSLAHDRDAASEREFDLDAYTALLADTERRIAERAEERALALVEQRHATTAAATGPPSAVAATRVEIGPDAQEG